MAEHGRDVFAQIQPDVDAVAAQLRTHQPKRILNHTIQRDLNGLLFRCVS